MWDHFHHGATLGKEEFSILADDFVASSPFSFIGAEQVRDLFFVQVGADWIVGFGGWKDFFGRKFPDPNVSKADWISVILESDWEFLTAIGVGVVLHPRGRSKWPDVVLY